MAIATGTRVLVDVTDLVEFATRSESPSGVQRVVLGVLPFLVERSAEPVALDRSRGVLVALAQEEVDAIAAPGAVGTTAVQAAKTTVSDLPTRPAISGDPSTVCLFPGAVWINDALMIAARALHAEGTRLVFFLYDLTPVLQTGHTAAVNMLYERYLTLTADTGARVPAISESSRRDYETWCRNHGRDAPGGVATKLPNGLNPGDYPHGESPWPRPYALFVGTIESRKNHEVALAAWEELVDQFGRQRVPDLVCIGRLGWHADRFLEGITATQGLAGKVSVLTSSVTDQELARFYAHADFTIYPSQYEGWGLPISESLAFGVPVITADNSSLREAGGDAAMYVETGNASALASAVAEHFVEGNLEVIRGAELSSRAPVLPTWQQVAETLWDEVAEASCHRVEAVGPKVEIGHEYVLGSLEQSPDGAHADVFLRHLVTKGRSPLLGQLRDARDFEVVDAALIGSFGAPQSWGLQVAPQQPLTLRFSRSSSEELTLLLGTRSMPGKAFVEVISPIGTERLEVYLGSVISIPMGSGTTGEATQARVTVLDATDSIEGFLGVSSFVVLPTDDLQTQLVAERSAARALRQELDFITGSRSWKITSPLRRWKGRGSR